MEGEIEFHNRCRCLPCHAAICERKRIAKTRAYWELGGKEEARKRYLENRDAVKARAQLWRQTNKDRLSDTRKNYRKRLAFTDPAKYMIERCHRHRRRGHGREMECNLYEHIDQIRERLASGVCELSGLPFSDKRPFRPSIDRIDSSKGYTYDNIRIVCLAANLMMNDWGLWTMLTIANAIQGRLNNAARQTIKTEDL